MNLAPSSKIRSLTIYVDGASRGNPGPAGIGVLIEDEGGLRREHLAYIGEATNNVAEYRALLLALQKAKRLRPQKVTVFSDSELLVRQLRGEYRVKSPKLQKLHRAVLSYLTFFPFFQIEHIGREQNRRADELANLAIDRALRKGGS